MVPPSEYVNKTSETSYIPQSDVGNYTCLQVRSSRLPLRGVRVPSRDWKFLLGSYKASLEFTRHV